MTNYQIRKAREKLGLSQAQLAKELDVKQNTVSDWEAGKYQARGIYCKEIKRLLGEIIGIEMLDNIIITPSDNFYSFLKEGKI